MADGETAEVHTPFTTRAKELLELYNGLALPLLTVDERLDVLLHGACAVWSVCTVCVCVCMCVLLHGAWSVCVMCVRDVCVFALCRTCCVVLGERCVYMLYVCVFFVATHTIYSPTFHPSPPPPPPPPLFPPVKWTVKEFDCNLTRSIVELIDREADLLNRGRAESSLDGLRKRLLNLFLQFIETPEFNPEVREEEKRRETEQQGWGHTKPHNTTSCVVCECGHFMLNSYVSPSPLFSDLVSICLPPHSSSQAARFQKVPQDLSRRPNVQPIHDKKPW